MEETMLSYLPRDLLLLLEDYTSQAVMLEIEDVDEGDIYLDLLIGCGVNAVRFPLAIRAGFLNIFLDSVVLPGKAISLSGNEDNELPDLTRTSNDLRITHEAISKPFYIFPPKQATLLLGKLRSLLEDYTKGMVGEIY